MDFVNYFAQFGYLGIFLISVIGSISVIFPIPYTISYYIFGATMDPLFVAIVGGLGSAIGEVSGYLLGYYGQRLVNEKQKKKMIYLMKIFDRYGPITLFLFALTPLPDDLLFIPLGILRYSFVKAFIPTLVGKILMAYILAYSGKISLEFIRVLFSGAGWFAVIITVSLLLVIVIAIIKIDWEKIFKTYIEKRQKE